MILPLLFMACLLLFAYPLDPLIPAGSRAGAAAAAALVWRALGRTLVRLDPQQYVLLDGGVPYVYQGVRDSPHTYVPAVRLDTGRTQQVLNHRYLRDWLREPARVVWYEPGEDVVQSLNRLREAIV